MHELFLREPSRWLQSIDESRILPIANQQGPTEGHENVFYALINDFALKANVDAGNLLQIGEIVELHCSSKDPIQYPLTDNQDQNPDDHKLTVVCEPPYNPGGPGW